MLYLRPGFHKTVSALDSAPDSAGGVTGACTVDMSQALQTGVSISLWYQFHWIVI